MKSLKIRPSRDLRNNYSQISNLAKTNPVAITVNGKEDIVILSHKDYMKQLEYIEELEGKLRIYSLFAEAEDDVRNGRVQSVDDAFDDILKSIKKL